MGGNVWEWTTESFSYTRTPYTGRGGRYSGYFANYPAGGRSSGSDGARGDCGFRLTLFL